MNAQMEKVIETISEPDLLQTGDFGEILALRFFSKTLVTQKYLTAAYREISATDGFLLTAYFTNSPSKRRKI